MSQSPLEETLNPEQRYLDSWRTLAQRIREGNSFSGREPNCLFLNTGGPRYADASSCFSFDLKDDSRGLAVVDWDHDGDLDVWLSNRTGPRVRFLRNELGDAGSQRSVSLLLSGDPARGVSRDAIGTRVELAISENGKLSRQMRTVTAGNGFISQSTRWLHFGLGKSGAVQSIKVRWPTGVTEILKGAEPGGRYGITFGQRKLVPAAGGKRALSLKPSPVAAPEITDAGRVWLKTPLPLPSLIFLNPDGAKQSVKEGPHRKTGQALLVNLWAPWCQPCRTELRDFTEYKDTLSGVSILALNVEEPDAQARELLEDTIGFPFAHGSCPTEFVEAIDALVQKAIYRHRGIPVPFSFLIGADNKVHAIYKGPVSAGRLAADAVLLRAPLPDRRDAAVPFAGRWSHEKFITNPTAVAGVYLEDVMFDEARAYLLKSLQEERENPNTSTQHQKRLADLLFHLGRIDEAEEDPTGALKRYRESVAAAPTHFGAQAALANLLSREGKHAEAKTAIARVEAELKGRPDVSVLHSEILVRAGQAKTAAGRLESLVNSRPRYYQARQKLVELLATSPDPTVRNPKRALDLSNDLRRHAPGNPRVIATIATATHAAGNKAGGLNMLRSALTIANRDSDAALASELRHKLKEWEAGD